MVKRVARRVERIAESLDLLLGLLGPVGRLRVPGEGVPRFVVVGAHPCVAIIKTLICL